MNIIVYFCILFIGSLIFWEFSKIILIKTVEGLVGGEIMTPKKIKYLQWPMGFDPIAHKIGSSQAKLNEVIRGFNKMQKSIPESKDSSSDTAKPISELDLSTINDTHKELMSIQMKLNELIKPLSIGKTPDEPALIPLNLSTRATILKKLDAILSTVNQVINAFNIYITNLYKEGAAKVADKTAKSDESKNNAARGNHKNAQVNAFLNRK